MTIERGMKEAEEEKKKVINIVRFCENEVSRMPLVIFTLEEAP